MSDIVRELRLETNRMCSVAADEIERLTALTATQAEDIGQQTRREEGLRTEIERLQAAAKKVCWYDWSDNDADAVAAINELRRALEEKK